MRNYDQVVNDTKRDEQDIEVEIEFAYDKKEIDKKEYLELICLIRIAKGLNDLAIVSGNYANFIANKK